MRRSFIIATAGILAVAAAGGYYGLEVYPRQQFRDGLDQTLASLPLHAAATYKDADYAPLSHRAVVTGLAIHAEIPGQAPQKADLTIDSIEVSDPNLDFARAWNDARKNPAALTPDTMVPVAGSVTVKGMTLHAATFTATQSSVTIDKLRFYPWAVLHDHPPAAPETPPIPASGPAALLALQPLLRAEAAIGLGVAYEDYKAGTTHVSATEAGIDVSYDIAGAIGEGFDRGVQEGGSIDGVTVKSAKLGSVSIAHATVGKFDVRQVLTRIAQGAPLSPDLIDGLKSGTATYSGISIQPLGKPLIHADSLSIGPTAFAHGMPVAARLGWQNLSLARALFPNPRAQEAFQRLNLDTMTISFAVSYDWDLGQQRVTLRDTMLKVNELGTLTLSADLTNVIPSPAGSPASPRRVSPLALARLAHARLRFEDASLTERLLRASATQAGADPAAFRQRIVDMMHQRSAALAADSPPLAAAWQAVGDFIAAPQSLTVELSPPTPVPFIALALARTMPVQFAAMLGLSVTANKP